MSLHVLTRRHALWLFELAGTVVPLDHVEVDLLRLGVETRNEVAKLVNCKCFTVDL